MVNDPTPSLTATAMQDSEPHFKQEIYPILSPDEVDLTVPVDKYSFDKKTYINTWELAGNLVNTMKSKKGIGLAANQCGINARVFVMDGLPPIACFNPRIVDVSEEMILLEEGCLTYPGLSVKVKRHKHIKVRYQDPDGVFHTEKLTGMTARIFQHEMDHLDGIRFFDRADRYHRDQAMRRWKNWRRKNG